MFIKSPCGYGIVTLHQIFNWFSSRENNMLNQKVLINFDTLVQRGLNCFTVIILHLQHLPKGSKNSKKKDYNYRLKMTLNLLYMESLPFLLQCETTEFMSNICIVRHFNLAQQSYKMWDFRLSTQALLATVIALVKHWTQVVYYQQSKLYNLRFHQLPRRRKHFCRIQRIQASLL